MLVRSEVKARLPEASNKIKREHSSDIDFDPPGLPSESANRIAVLASGDPTALQRQIASIHTYSPNITSQIKIDGPVDNMNDTKKEWKGYKHMMEELLPQLWFTEVTNLLLVQYKEEVFTLGLDSEEGERESTKGYFERIAGGEEIQGRTRAVITKLSEKDLLMSKEQVKWELRNEDNLKRLITLLQEVVKVAKEEGRVDVLHDNSGSAIKIVKVETMMDVLPPNLKNKLPGERGK
jgi:hypothetical protein